MMLRKAFALILLTAPASVASISMASTEVSVKAWTRTLESGLKGRDVNEVLKTLQTSTLTSSLQVREATPARQALLTARKLYSQGQYTAAIKQYDRVPKGTDEWLEAVEEKGWAFLRMGQTDRALAQTKTLVSPTFRGIVGTEPFYLQSLTQLRVCDYVSVLETHKLLKESQRERMMALQNLADTGRSKELDQVIARVDRFPLKLSDLGEESRVLPRMFHRDIDAQTAILQIRLSEAGIPALQASAASNTRYRTLAMRQIKRLQEQSAQARKNLQARVKTLASRETDRNFELLQKINIIEVETIQRVHIDQALDKGLYSQGEFAKTNVDQMVFVDDGHPWIDELDKFQVRLNACPGKVRRKM